MRFIKENYHTLGSARLLVKVFEEQRQTGKEQRLGLLNHSSDAEMAVVGLG